MIANVLLFLLAAVVAVCRGAEVMKLGELDAKYRCVSGRMDGIKGEEGGGGRHYVTVEREHTIVVQLKETPKDTFRAMVQSANHLHYELVVDYKQRWERKCGNAIEELVRAEGCWLVKDWHGGRCVGGKCSGAWLRVECKLSNEQQVQEDRGPTGYSVADVTVWSSEGTPCLSVSAKFTHTDKNFCYLVLQSEVKDQNQIKTVKGFMGMTTTTKTTTAETTTMEKTTTEGSSNKTTMTIQNTTTAETKTTPANGTTKKVTKQTTKKDKHGPKPTKMGPAEEEEEHGDEDEQAVHTSLPYCMALAWPFPLLFHLAINLTVILVGVVLLSLCMFSELIHDNRRR